MSLMDQNHGNLVVSSGESQKESDIAISHR